LAAIKKIPPWDKGGGNKICRVWKSESINKVCVVCGHKSRSPFAKFTERTNKRAGSMNERVIGEISRSKPTSTYLSTKNPLIFSKVWKKPLPLSQK
jgi:Zn ribbon nucleic-acid-binding protein